MTHTPTLPNGFSRDFSEAPDAVQFLMYAVAQNGDVIRDFVAYVNGEMWCSIGIATDYYHPLCWCPIPTPGDDVLKELAEGKP